MDFSQMLLDEAPVQARAPPKFQPRPKQRPRRETSASVAATNKDVSASEKQGFSECNNDPGGEGCPDISEKHAASGLFSHDAAGKLAASGVGADCRFQAQLDTGPIKENNGSKHPSVSGELNVKTTTSIRFGSDHCSELLHAVDGSENFGLSPSQQGAQPSKQTKVDGFSDSNSALSRSVDKDANAISVVEADDILGHSSMNTANFVSLDPSTSEQPMSDYMLNALETSNPNDVPSEDASKMPEVEGFDSVKLNSYGTFNPSDKSTSSFTPGDDQRVRISSRQLRKQGLVSHVDDEPEDDTSNDGSPAFDHPTTAANDVIEDTSVENVSGGKRRNAVARNKRFTPQSKKVSEASVQQAKQTQKKFPRGTRRKRRNVSQDLLDIPEQEYDRLPMKDIILLGEYREHLEKKDAKALNVSASSASQNPSNDTGDHNEEGFNEFEHQQGPGDYNTDQVFQTSSGFFNYQSFMKKEPRVRWSKQETALFYEAIQQFGTDFSMVQQLFPGRSRRQMKAKYRLEERKHPLRMSEASVTRSKDLSHFERLAQQLQAAASKSEHTKDNSEGMADREHGPTPETNAAKVPEHEKPDREAEEQGAEPGKTDGSDYDDDMCTYESVF